MEAAPNSVYPSAAPSVSVKRGGGGSENGRNWPLPCFLATMLGVTGNVASNSPLEGLVRLFNRELFSNIVSYSIPTNGATC